MKNYDIEKVITFLKDRRALNFLIFPDSHALSHRSTLTENSREKKVVPLLYIERTADNSGR